MKSSKMLVRVLISLLGLASAADFLKAGLIAESDAKAFLSAELDAYGASSSSVEHQKFERIRERISTMYASLPKNAAGLLTHQAVRYALHRYFAREHGWFIRGLEPNNDTWHETADPDSHGEGMKEWVPTFLQDILEKKLGQQGTDLEQLAVLAAALEDLVRREAKGRLETTYKMYEYSIDLPLNREEVDELLQTYFVAVVNWGELTASTRMEVRTETKSLISGHPAWADAKSWLEDLKSKHLVAGSDFKFDFQSLLRVVDKLDEEYNTLNDQDCTDLKSALRKMQGKTPGRVRLASLYRKGVYRHWDFSDKKEFLRSLGVLDETDAEHPSVIITNYLLSRNNCLDSSHLFAICCKNECEDLMNSLEEKIGGAMADPDRLAEMVAAMPSATKGANRLLSDSQLDKLHEVARLHGGQVPLHGRLFAQWMHHIYPGECPFPHEIGAVNPMTREEWMKESGQDSEKATKEEMAEHIGSDTCKFDPNGAAIDCEGETAEIAWTDKEELLTWHPQGSARYQSASVWTFVLACCMAAVGLLLAVKNWRSSVAWRPFMVTLVLALLAFAVGLLDGTLLFLVLACGCVVVIANHMTAGNSPREAHESKQCV